MGCDILDNQKIESCDGVDPMTKDFIERGCLDCPKLFKKEMDMLNAGVELTVKQGPPSGEDFYQLKKRKKL